MHTCRLRVYYAYTLRVYVLASPCRVLNKGDSTAMVSGLISLFASISKPINLSYITFELFWAVGTNTIVCAQFAGQREDEEIAFQESAEASVASRDLEAGKSMSHRACFLCPTKNWYLLQTVCTNSVVLQEQNDGAEWAENQAQKTRVLFREVGREKSPRRGYKGGKGVRKGKEN